MQKQAPGRHVIEGVPFISQLIHYPTGCESVSAVMALNFWQAGVTPEEFMDTYLPRGAAPVRGADGQYRGCDPWEAFPGDPYTDEGWGCFAPVIVKAIANLNAARKTAFTATALYEVSIEELCHRFIDANIPVVFWATLNMAEPRRDFAWHTAGGRKIEWVSPMHCLLLIGYDENGYIFNDPTGGERAYYPKAQVEKCYRAQGRQVVIITAGKGANHENHE